MYKSKKAQISDTISWLVATVIIVLILSIPILLVNLGGLNPNKLSFNRVQDPIATKSISGYLIKDYPPMKTEVEGGQLTSETQRKLELFLYSLTRNENIEGWNLLISTPSKEEFISIWNKLFSSDKEIYNKISYDVLFSKGVSPIFFYIKGDSNGAILTFKFWREGQMYA